MSTNNGASWTDVTAFTAGHGPAGISCDDNGRWVAIGNSSAHYSDDDGASRVPTNASHIGVGGVNTDKNGKWIAVGSSNSVWISDDGGGGYTKWIDPTAYLPGGSVPDGVYSLSLTGQDSDFDADPDGAACRRAIAGAARLRQRTNRISRVLKKDKAKSYVSIAYIVMF